MVTIENLKKAEQAVEDARAELGIKRDTFNLLAKKFIEENAKVPEQSFAKAKWVRNGRQGSGVVFVTVNNLYPVGHGYEVRPTFIKCEPIPADCDDGKGPHYYSEHWEKKRKFISYDTLLSIEPYDAPRQYCKNCAWIGGSVKDGQLHVGCRINLGYKCEGGEGCACDRFRFWSWPGVTMTHVEYLKERAAKEPDKQYFN